MRYKGEGGDEITQMKLYTKLYFFLDVFSLDLIQFSNLSNN